MNMIDGQNQMAPEGEACSDGIDQPTGSLTRGRRRLFAIMAIALGLILAIILGEAAIRIYLYMTFRGTLANLSNDIPTDPEIDLTFGNLIFPVDNDNLIYRLKPNARGRFRHVPVEINSLGFRDAETTLAKPAGVFRIVVLGDSNSFGWGTTHEEGYVELLEQSLNRLVGDAGRIEALNLSVPGYNAVMEVEFFQALGLKLDPDLVIIQYCGNDNVLPPFVLDTPDFANFNRFYILNIGFALELIDRIRNSTRISSIAPVRIDIPQNPEEQDPASVPARYHHHLGPEATEEAYRCLRDECRRKEIPLFCFLPALMLWDWKSEKDRDPLYDQIKGITARLEIPTIDSFNYLRRVAIENPGLAQFLVIDPEEMDMHPTPLRHTLFVESLLPVIAGAMTEFQISDEAVSTEMNRLAERRNWQFQQSREWLDQYGKWWPAPTESDKKP